jgi:dimethylglycine dehydrogenase
MSTITKDGVVIGETTSGAWGYRVGHSVALAMVKAEHAAPGTELDVNIYGEICKAVVQGDGPLWDPANERIRA